MSIEVYSSVSADFVSPLFPKKGDEIRISIIFSRKPDSVLLFSDCDSGTLSSSVMKWKGTYNGAFIYESSCMMTSSDDIFHYYFAFIHQGKSWYYGKSGMTRFVPSLNDRFSLIPSLEAPEWVEGAVCYQIFPDRFYSGDPSVGAREGEYEFDGGRVTTPSFDSIPRPFSESRCLDFYNGDLKGIEEKLPYLKSLGVNVIYLNPINASRTVHRYDAVDFFHVDEKLGGDEAFRSLMEKAHECGIRVIVDISINHTGTEAEWFRKAVEDPSSAEHGFYSFDENGNPRFWQGVKTLAQLNYTSDILRDRVYRAPDSAMQKFLRFPFMQDGWRLDVAPEVGRYGSVQLTKEVWREVRKALKSVKKDLYLVGEDWDDSSEYLQGDMWDGVMNYYGVSRPVRSWMGERDRFLSAGWGYDPEREAEWSGGETAEALCNAIMAVPSQSAFFQMNLFDSHDTPRLHSNAAIMDPVLYHGAVIALFMLPGMPSIYYGDEIGIGGRMGSPEGCRYPMEWNEERWDRERLRLYSVMADIRKMDFFPYSAFRAEEIDNDAFVLFRIGRGKAIAAIINRCPRERHVTIDSFMLPHGSCRILYGDADASVSDGSLTVRLAAKESAVLYLADTSVPEKS